MCVITIQLSGDALKNGVESMADEHPDQQHRRRTFLQTIGALGASSAIAPGAAAAQEASTSLDDYHTTLQSELTASDRKQRQLPSGEYVYGTTEQAALDAFSLQGAGTESTISVDTDAVPITTADRLEITADATEPHDATYRGTIEAASVSEGDRLLGVAYVRSESADARATARFTYQYTDSVGQSAYSESFVVRGAEIEPSGEWLRYYFPIEVGAKPSGSNHVPAFEFRTGCGEQTVEIGGIALFDYGGTDVSLSTLPPYDYAGRAEDAAWRGSAQERIETHRKTDLEVEVLDPGGGPMNRAEVEVEMVEHTFDFGSAVSVEHLTDDSATDETYRETFLEDFNKAVIENGLKYPAWEGEWDIPRGDTLTALDWLNARDIPIRGHYLLWEQFSTDGGGGMSVENAASKSGEELRTAITEKILNHVETFEGSVSDWDMHNHPIWQSNFREDDRLGWDAVRTWWDAAAEATDLDLYANEMGVVGGAWQRSQYLDFITHLHENDYPLGGIAFMGHHQQQWNQLLDVDDMIAGFEAFSDFGVPILVSEFDIEIFSRRNAQDVAVQADYTRDFLTVAFSMPAVEGVLSWGFWAGDHWRPTGAYYDEDWTRRPNGDVYQDLVFDEWWTEDAGRTDRDGAYSTRGFKGTYRISAEKGALAGETTVTIGDDTGTVTVELTPPGQSEDEGDTDAHDAADEAEHESEDAQTADA